MFAWSCSLCLSHSSSMNKFWSISRKDQFKSLPERISEAVVVGRPVRLAESPILQVDVYS